MLTLGFDTATGVGTIGLVDDGEVVGEFSFGAEESQSERLLYSIDLLLDQTNREISDVEKIAVSRGPGSFTGLRIGISTAKGLARGLEIPLVGVPLTYCYYSRIRNFSGPVCTIIEDRRDLVYYAAFDETGEKVGKEESIPVDEIEERLDLHVANREDSTLLVGDAVPKHEEKLTEIDRVILAEGELNYPSGLQIAFLGAKVKESKDELASLEPLYAQRPIAEINWNRS